MISYFSSESSLTVYVNGKAYTVDNGHKNILRIREALAEGNQDKLETALDIKKALVDYTQGKVTVKGEQVLYDGQPCHHKVVDKILDFIQRGLDFKPLVAFLDNIKDNGSMSCCECGFDFIDRGNLPITSDGHFLAYRCVRNDYKDWYSNSVDNSPGQKPFMERKLCDDTRGLACSKGFHVGTLNYVHSFHWGEGRCIIVKVNPKDIVSLPAHGDTTQEKIRVNTYEVVGEYTKPLCDSVCGDYDHDCCRSSEECCDCEPE